MRKYNYNPVLKEKSMARKPIDVTQIIPCIDPEEDVSPDARREVLHNFFKQAPVATKADAVRFLVHHYPSITDGGHRAFVKRTWKAKEKEKPWEKYQNKQCPKCSSTTASGNEEVQELFGFRKSGEKWVPQSWCRSCR